MLPVQITGRDWVYEAIAEGMTGYAAVFGPGAPALVQGTGGWVVGEHGQAPHVLLQLGWVGFVLFLLAMIALVRFWGTVRADHLLGFGILLVPASRFLTEPSLMFSTRTVEFVAICLSMTLLATPWTRDRPRAQEKALESLRSSIDNLVVVDENGSQDRRARLGHEVERRH